MQGVTTVREIVGLAVFAALAYTGWKFYEKAQHAKLATPAGLLAITDAVKELPASTRRPFNLDPILVG
jgi:hypothetical protein